MRKRYNTPHRSRVVKTRMTEEEYAEFAERLSAYNMSQAEFIRQAITGAAIRPIITVSPVNDELLAAVGKLTAEYGRIGGNLNQIARTLNEWHSPYPQLALDKENAAREAAGQPTKPTKFETDKAKLRRTIRQALSQATSFDEFSSLLLREGVTVKESRGRLSYLTPDRTKPITARKLGDDFDKAAVLALLTQNAHRAAEQTTDIPEYPHTQKERLREEKAAKTTPADNTLQRMVDREAKRAEGKGVGYDRWAAKHNLKQMAATVTAYQQYGFSSPEELDEACSAAYTAMRESLTELKQMEKTLNGKKELQRQVLAYSKTRPVRDGLKQQKNAKAKAAYRQKHESDFIIADAAARYFRENGISKLPSYKALQAEIESLIQEKNSGYNDYRAKREEYRRLQTVKGNIDQILRRERKPVKRQEQER